MLARTVCTPRIALGLIKVQQNETLFWRGALPVQELETTHRHLHAGQGITGTRAQFLNMKVDGQIGIADQVLQKACITDL